MSYWLFESLRNTVTDDCDVFLYFNVVCMTVMNIQKRTYNSVYIEICRLDFTLNLFN